MRFNELIAGCAMTWRSRFSAMSSSPCSPSPIVSLASVTARRAADVKVEEVVGLPFPGHRIDKTEIARRGLSRRRQT
jgi:hypothetical protein